MEKKVHVHVTSRRCLNGNHVALVRLTSPGDVDWRSVLLPSPALSGSLLDAVVATALRYHAGGHGARLCAEYQLRLPMHP
ncbi:hypothetical protein EKK70_06855 [Desulfovibrio sp. DS-1]|nr:hypothetical protein EKK70_06855 [Desulfovibrio sp. DS-1]